MAIPSLKSFAIPGVSLLIAFLSYSSQYLFHRIEPGPLTGKQTVIFNLFVAGIWVSYFRACFTDPSRGLPQVLKETVTKAAENEEKALASARWCKKCEAPKPARAHHCKECRRCIPKMDHHCPWTYNCVSHATLPHFIRFLTYAVISMSYLSYFLFLRLQILWSNRNLPSYLGPTVPQLVHLFILTMTNTFTLLILAILLARTIYGLVFNMTTIESWEIERHATLVRRARLNGGWVDGQGGQRIRLVKREFPYDIGVWQNIVVGMGTANVLSWGNVFARTLKGVGKKGWDVNGFEDKDFAWPPPDPDRMPRSERKLSEEEITLEDGEEGVKAFKKRQLADYKRLERFKVEEQFESDEENDENDNSDSEKSEDNVLGRAWRNSDGERLRDFGVDEDVEFEEENIPLGELIRRRKARELEAD